MSNLRDRLTEEEFTELVESLQGRDRFPCDDEQKPKDLIVEKVLTKFKRRSELGINKYNTTLQDNNLTIYEWLNHAQEEAMDLALYLEKIKNILKDV